MKVFSFCLYGTRDKYCLGLIENIKIINEYFPSWKVFVYYASDVPNEILKEIQGYQNVVLRFTNVKGPMNTIHRFYAIDEDGVEIMIVRDADSRIHERDRWSINAWLNSGKGVHIVRDHRYHTAFIMGGMWGIHKRVLKENIRSLFEKYGHTYNNAYGVDQYFLQRVIYPLACHDALYHCCIKKSDVETITPIPFDVVDDDFIGQVIEYDHQRNPVRHYKYIL